MACTANFALNSVIRGHHVYKTVWSPFIGEILHLQTDAGNVLDTHAVSVVKNSVLVDHAPREMSQIFFYFLQHGGSISTDLLATESTAIDWRCLAITLSQGSANT